MFKHVSEGSSSNRHSQVEQHSFLDTAYVYTDKTCAFDLNKVKSLLVFRFSCFFVQWLGRLLGAFSRCEAFCLHLLFVFQEASPLAEILYLQGKMGKMIKSVNCSTLDGDYPILFTNKLVKVVDSLS